MNNKIVLPLVFTTLLAARAEAKQPNIVFILADDLGYSELGCYGNTFNETPNLDRLAAEGVRFTNAYSAQTVSSPTRAALMTGLYPHRTGIVDFLRPDDGKYLDESYTTLPEILRANGYRTAIIGKWHLSGYLLHGREYESTPDKHGFDEAILNEKEGIAAVSCFHPYHFNRDVEKRLPDEHEFLVDRMNFEAVDFIARQGGEQPFFLFVSHYATHFHVHGKPEDVERFSAKPGAGRSKPHRDNPQNDPYKKWPSGFLARKNNPHLAAQLYTIDQGVGMIVEKLKEQGLYENTIIIFTSDNGGYTGNTSNAPLRGGKGTLYEGGIRVCLLASAPGKIKRGTVCDEPFITFDHYPTLCDVSGVTTRGVRSDGFSFASVLAGRKTSVGTRNLFWHYPLEEPHHLGLRSSCAVREGRWKLLDFYNAGEIELYDLQNDVGETHNLAAQYPAIVHRMKKKLDRWQKDVEAHK